ncbi:alpha/beta fold hydrolase [Paraburkholderia fungorum]|uniref:alpha/beta hydrolase n=1 Tax=Paraburkholderia fungorum TaxID=134537 RepID=UPI0038B894E2
MKYLSKFFAILFLTVLATGARAQTGNPDADNQLHNDLSLQYLVHLPSRSTSPPPVIILLHGMGSNEQDLYSLLPELPQKYAIISARAPYTLAEGSYQWFQGTLVNNRLDGDPQQLAASRVRIGGFVDQVVTKYRLDPHQVYLVGFSQGAILSYQVALTEPAKIRGIGVMSGAIFGSFVPLIKPSPALSHLRIFISHGQADHRIPIGYALEADQRLKGLGLKPEFHVYAGMQHEINSDALADLVNWLRGS